MIRYMTAQYKDGGRGEGNQFDCWGLTRAARHELYGRELLPERPGQHRLNVADFHKNFTEQAEQLQETTDPEPGVIVAILKGRLCEHVALIVADVQRTGLGLHVLETNPRGGVLLQPLSRFIKSNRHRIIKFYDDQNLP